MRELIILSKAEIEDLKNDKSVTRKFRINKDEMFKIDIVQTKF